MVATNFDLAAYMGVPPALLAIVVIWSMVWMAIAMWKSARKNHLIWFIVFVLIHTLGILEILYIFVFSKMSSSRPEAQAARRKRR